MKRSNREDVAEGFSETQLWQEFKEGNEEAFAKIFHRYHKKLCHYGYRIVADKDIVKDCVQELFISLWNNRERLDYTVAINFYLIKSLRGRILRVLNKQKKLGMDAISMEESSHEFLFLSTEDTMITEQSQQEQQEQLLKALNNLSKKHREVIYLKFFLDLSYQQIAEVMAVNYQVTRNYAYQAVKILREKIDLVVCISLINKLMY